MSYKLYGDLMSQPCRAVALHLRVLQVPHEIVPVLIHKRQNRDPAFLKVNPMGQIPALQDASGYTLTESTTQLRYLALKHDHSWYPQTPLTARLAVDQAIDFYHSGLRQGAMPFAFERGIASVLGATPSEEVATRARAKLKRVFRVMEHWLSDGRAFLTGDAISIADLSYATELMQLKLVPPAEFTLEQVSPVVAAYVGRVAARTAPHWDDVHKLLLRAAAKREAERAAAAAAKPLQ